MLAAARKDLGLSGRPNWITRAYSGRNGKEFLTAPWCNQAVTEWARGSGNAPAVLPNGDRAYTVWHAQDGRSLGRWHAGTVANIKKFATPGCPIYFDWDGTDDIPKVDHIGVIETILPDGRVVTIEANTGDAVKRRVRSASVIAGFWTPDYGDDATAAAASRDWLEDIVNKLPLLKKGCEKDPKLRPHIKTAYYLLAARGLPMPGGVDDTTYGDALVKRVKDLQKAKKLKDVDGEVGPDTWPKLLLP